VANQVRQLGYFEDVGSPIINTHIEYMEEDVNLADTCREDRQAPRADLPPSGSGAQPTGATTAGTSGACTTPTGVTLPTVVTRLRFGTLEPPTIPISARGGTYLENRNSIEHQNTFAPRRQRGNE